MVTRGQQLIDDGSDCVRVATTSPFVGDDVVTENAQALVASWTTE